MSDEQPTARIREDLSEEELQRVADELQRLKAEGRALVLPRTVKLVRMGRRRQHGPDEEAERRRNPE